MSVRVHHIVHGYRVLLADRKSGHKFVMSLVQESTGRVLLKKKTINGIVAEFRLQGAKRLCDMLHERRLSVQAAELESVDSLKALVASYWEECE